VEDVVAVAMQSEAGADLASKPSPRGSGTLEEARQALVGKLGENIQVRRWDRLAVADGGLVHSYVHMGGKIGVILAVETAHAASAGAKSDVLGKFVEETAMQIAAMSPQFVTRASCPPRTRTSSARSSRAAGGRGQASAARPRSSRASSPSGSRKCACSISERARRRQDRRSGARRRERSSAPSWHQGFVRYERGEGLAVPQGPTSPRKLGAWRARAEAPPVAAAGAAREREAGLCDLESIWTRSTTTTPSTRSPLRAGRCAPGV
jgi:elongation factor Ts